MPEEEKSKNLDTRLKEVVENANQLAGLVAAVIAAIAFFSGNREVLYFFSVIICAYIDWLLWTGFTDSPEKRGKSVITRRSRQLHEPVGSASTRRKMLAIVLIMIVTLASLGWIAVNFYQDRQQMQAGALRAQGYYAPTATLNEQLIVLSEFDFLGSKKYDPTRRIRDKLDEELQKANITNARIVVTPKLSTKEEARTLGERHKAIFVIWGWYDDNGITPNFTIIKESENPLAKTETAEVIAEPARDFALYISQGLPAQMSYFATFTVGQLYYWDKQYDRALGAFDVAVANLEQSRRVEGITAPSGSAILYLYRGYIYSVVKVQLDQAIADYTKAIELDPKYAKAYYNRGIAYQGNGNPDQAIADYTKAIELDPKHAKAFYNRGVDYQDNGNLDQAIADYTKAIELDPKYAKAYNNRGIAYLNKGNLDLAIADYTKAIELDPKDARRYNNRGVAYQDNGNLDQAIADYTKAIELDPKDANAYHNRGTAYQANANLDQAIADYTKAIELDPKDANAYYNRGFVYQANANLDQAIADYTKAIELDPKDANAYHNRGFAYRQKGMKPQAVADFQMYLQIAPNASDRAQLEQLIRELQ